MILKHAIRIVDATTGERKLFAVVKTQDVNEYRVMARNSAQYGDSDWITVNYWNDEFERDMYFDFPAGNLF